jgi:phenylacetate-CoA ligase
MRAGRLSGPLPVACRAQAQGSSNSLILLVFYSWSSAWRLVLRCPPGQICDGFHKTLSNNRSRQILLNDRLAERLRLPSRVGSWWTRGRELCGQCGGVPIQHQAQIAAVPVRSAATDILWPAVAQGAGGQLAALLFQLEQSQWWPAAALREQQLRQLGPVLAHAFDTVPAYRARLQEAGFKPGDAASEALLQRIPLLTRDEIQRSAETLRSQRVPKAHGAVRSASTSGSTGQTLRVHATELNNFMWMAFTMRDHLWHARDVRKKLAVIRYQPPKGDETREGRVADNWGAPVNLLYASGPCVSLHINTDVASQVAWLQRHAPHYLLTYPSNLKALAMHCREHGVELACLEEVRTISEILHPGTRELCREVFGASIVDAYTCNEVGYIALQCPTCEQYHLQMENVLCEILDDDNRPCAPGEMGRVVVTALHNFAMPLIRYELRDYAEPGEPCACGRGLPTLRRILGRERNMICLPNGERRYPTGFTQWGELAPVAQFQIIQRSVRELEARLVTRRPLTAEDEGRLRDAITRTYATPFDIRFTYLEELRGHANGKFEEFISEIPGA